MCGRYALAFDSEAIAAQFEAYNLEVHPYLANNEHHLETYNIAPTTDGAVYRAQDNELRYMKWGLVPHWTENIAQFKTYKTFNARLENLQESKMWMQCCNNKRCVIPISGYYEWKTQGKKKFPYYIKRKDNKLIFLAGMYDYVEKNELWSYTIVTNKAPCELAWLHARMPIILEPGSEAWKVWMDPEKVEWSQGELNTLLASHYDEKSLVVYRVAEDVGKVQNNGHYLIKPIYKEDRLKMEVYTQGGSQKQQQTSSIKKETHANGDIPQNSENLRDHGTDYHQVDTQIKREDKLREDKTLGSGMTHSAVKIEDDDHNKLAERNTSEESSMKNATTNEEGHTEEKRHLVTGENENHNGVSVKQLDNHDVHIENEDLDDRVSSINEGVKSVRAYFMPLKAEALAASEKKYVKNANQEEVHLEKTGKRNRLTDERDDLLNKRIRGNNKTKVNVKKESTHNDNQKKDGMGNAKRNIKSMLTAQAKKSMKN